MRQVDQQENFSPLGAPIRPEPTKPPGPLPEGPSGIVTDSQGRVQTTSHPKPPMRNYSEILDTQGMVHRDSFPPNSLKWVGEAADKWRQEQVMADPILIVRSEGTLSYAAGHVVVDSWHFETLNHGPMTRPANEHDVLQCVMDFIKVRAFEKSAPQPMPTEQQAGDAWHGIHAIQAADMAVIRELDPKADRD